MIAAMRRAALLLLVALSTSPVFAQVSVDADISWMNDDNVENNAFRFADRITSADVRLAYTHDAERSSFLVSAGTILNYFAVVPNRTFWMPTLQLHGGMILNDEETITGELSLGWSSRSGRNEYAFMDHRIFSGSLTMAYDPTEVFSVNGLYSYRSVSFTMLGPFDHSEHTFSASTAWSFETRTSVILRASLGAKLYDMAISDSVLSARGRNRTDGSAAEAVQAWTSIRIAQGITEHTGFSLTAQIQRNIRNNSASLAGTTQLISDEELFDDRYGYEGWTLSAMLTEVVWEGTRLRLAYTTQQKDYVLLPAFDLDGIQISDLRNDRRSTTMLALEHDFSFGSIQAVYEHIMNRSNDPLFDYPNTAFTVQLSVPIGF